MSSTLLIAGLLAFQAPDPAAVSTVDTALARMGGRSALERVVRVRMDMMTQWQRTSFEERPYTDLPSYEWHTDVRDYSIPAWRNTRRFAGAGATWREFTDIVRDSVAIRRMNGTWAPLNIAYLDERRELFAFAAERLLPQARSAPDLRSGADTTIGGIRHARVSATIDRFPATIFFRQTDGMPAMARYRAAQVNDFGLAPWGEMEVEVWYSKWSKMPVGVTMPTQLDIRRVGRPYKRITVLSIAFDTVATADSFAVSDSLRAAYLATATQPMYDLPVDSAKIIEGSFATFGAFGTPVGAVRVGNRWLLLEGGQAPLITERAVRWLEETGTGPLAGAIVTSPSGGNGGLAWLTRRQVPLHVARGALPSAGLILRNHGQPATAARGVVRGAWLRVGGDSLWLEPIDYPDAQGSLFIYVPSLRWAYSSSAAGGMPLDFLQARLKARGWTVDRIGSVRGIAVPVPAPRAAAP